MTSVDKWNSSHPVGTVVTYWKGVRRGAPSGRGRTRATAGVAGGRAVVWVTGVAEGIALTHVEVTSEAKADSPVSTDKAEASWKEEHCERCGNKKLRWQVMCGAACSAGSEMKLTMVFKEGPHWLIATSVEDAVEVYVDFLGEEWSRSEVERHLQNQHPRAVPSGLLIPIFVDDDTGETLDLTASQWCEREGRGFLATEN